MLQPPKRLYKRKRGVKFNVLEESDREEDKENAAEEQQTKKKRKHTKTRKNEKRINEWIQNVNSTFKEIDSYDLLIE